MLRSVLSVAAISVLGHSTALAHAGPFLRGDANGSGAIDISDMVHILGYLFLGSAPPDCEDAADLNDDGELLINDPIFGLNFLFSGGRAPPAPGTDTPGFDPTPGDPFSCGDPTPVEEVIQLKEPTGGFDTDPTGSVGAGTLPGTDRGVLIDLRTGQALGTFDTGRNPGVLRFSQNGPQLLVIDQGTPARPERTVTWVDFGDPRRLVARQLEIGTRVFDIVPVPRLDRAFALGGGTAEQPAEILGIVDTAKGEVLATLDVDFRPRAMDFSADGRDAFLIGDAPSPRGGDGLVLGAIARIDLAGGGKIAQTALLDDVGMPFDVRSTPLGTFVSDASGSERFSILKLNADLKVAGGIGRGWRAELLFTPDGTKGYSLTRPGNEVLIFDARTMEEIATFQLEELDTDPVGPPSRPSRRMIMTPDAATVLIVTGHGQLVGLDVKSDKPLGSIPLDRNDLGFSIDSLSLAADGKRLYLADGAGGVLTLLLSEIVWRPLLRFPWDLTPFLLPEIPITGDTCLQGIAILVDDGLEDPDTSFIDGANQEQSRNAIGRFYAAFPDIYDMVVTFYGSEFGDVTSPGAFAFAVPVRNFTRGLNRTIGRGQFGMSDTLDDADVDRLSNFMWENDLNEYDANHLCVNRPANSFGNLRDGLSILGQEVIHRWAAFADVSGNACTILRDPFHYSQFFNSDASVIGGGQGFRIADNGGGSFSHTAVETTISNLDEYLMGFRTAEQVTQALFCVSGPSPVVANSFTGNRVNITMDDFIDDNGERFPDANLSQRVFNVAYVLIVPDGDHVLRADLDEVKSFRDDFTAFFETQTEGRGHLNTRICPAPFTQATTIPLGVRANDVVVSPNGRWAYVTSVTADVVKVIDTDPASATFHTVIDTIDVSDAPGAVAFRTDSTRAFVVSINTDQVDVIDTATRAIIDHIPVGDQPRGIFTNSANFGFVTNSNDDDVTVFGTGSLEALFDIGVGDRPQGVAGTLDNEAVVYVNRSDATLTIHETRTGTRFTVDTGDNPTAVALVQSESLPNQTVARANASPSPVSIAYVVNTGSESVTVVGITTNPATVATTGTVLDTIPVGGGPIAVAFQPNGAIALVANRDDDTVSLIEVAKHEVYDTVTVGNEPEGVGFSPDGKRAYVANAGSMSVTVLE